MSVLTGRQGLLTAIALLGLGAALLLVGGSSGFGWVALTGVAGVVATGGVLRRLVGLLLSVLGLVAVSQELWGGGVPSADAARWPWVAGVGGGVVFLAGCVVALFAGRWSGLSGKYDYGSPAASSTPLDLWQALDAGEDPTDTANQPPSSDESTEGQR